jgi:putative tricarboxylic transport membrane protein
MSRRQDTVAALVLLAVFVAYGQQATQIDVFPGQEFEAFKPRTMPLTLALSGILLCVIRVFQSLRRPTTDFADWSRYDWKRAALLCLVMLGYGFAFTPLGFIIATTLFLLAGFFTLGERRKPLLLVLPPVFSLVFWAVMTQMLGLYLAPGSFWSGAGS